MRKITVSSFGLLFLVQLAVLPQTSGMHVNGRYLYSAGGDTVILKGFNAMIVYWDIHGVVNFPQIEKTGANCVRIFWNLDSPRPQPADLDQVLGNCIAHHMIPIICLWDATGDWGKIQYCVNYWCSAQIVPILQKYEKYLIVNIANEPGNDDMGDTAFKETYRTAVEQMRNAGIHVPLIIDADRYGRNADAVLDNGPYLMDQDPDHNLIFSWHLWDPQTWMTGTQAEIDRILGKAVNTNICFIVGEFGPCEQCDHCSDTKINWEYMIEKAFHDQIGYLPWVWKWTDCHSIVNNSSGTYGSWVNSPWGENVAVKNPYSIKNTAKRPSDLQTGAENNQHRTGAVSVFPNPFSGEVVFNISLDKPSLVKVVICDISGRQMAIPVDARLFPGNARVTWNSNGSENLNKGVYYFRLIMENQSGNPTVTGKIIKL
jgi:mannan endo-1,4-beta-mannosidase